MATFHPTPLDWAVAPGTTTTIVKRVIRLDVPVEKFPNEEKLKDKPGYEHLQEPLHILVEAEFSEDIINARIDYAVKILEDLLKPVVFSLLASGVPCSSRVFSSFRLVMQSILKFEFSEQCRELRWAGLGREKEYFGLVFD
nr:KH domain-containing protein At1g09660/At1g09670-like isoform X2 [Ipomoea batatas]